MSCMSTSRGPGRLSFSVEVSLRYSSPMETSDGPSAAAPSGLRSMLQSSELRLLSYNPTVCDRTTLDSIPFFRLRAFTSLFWEERESITIQFIVPLFYGVSKKEILRYSD